MASASGRQKRGKGQHQVDSLQDRQRRLDHVVKKHYRRITQAPHLAPCSSQDADNFFAGKELVFCSHVAAKVTREACREMRVWEARKNNREEPFYDVGPMRQCKSCPHHEGKPAPTLAEITVKCITLVLIEQEMKDRAKIYGRMA